MSYKILTEIIQILEEYQLEKRSESLAEFLTWTNNKVFSEEATETHSAHDDLSIAFKVMYLNKELKKNTKSIFLGTEISSIDEYSFLLHLKYQESFRKMELIELHNIEAPTGIEIIKRLLKNKLISEYADPNDRRAKRIKITSTGVSLIQDLEPKINQTFTGFIAPLELTQKTQLSAILNTLISTREED